MLRMCREFGLTLSRHPDEPGLMLAASISARRFSSVDNGAPTELQLPVCRRTSMAPERCCRR